MNRKRSADSDDSDESDKKGINSTFFKIKMKIKLRKEEKISLILVLTEIVIIGILMALNYILRFDEAIRDSSDMIALERVQLPCDPSYLRYEISRTFYDYKVDGSKSLDGLELDYELPEWVFFLTALLAPIGIFCVFEISKHYMLIRLMKSKDISTEKKNQAFPKPLRRLTRIVGGYLLGGAIGGLFSSVMKLNIISPRPNFMSICFPNETIKDYLFCSAQNYWKPIEVCENRVYKEISEGLKSFPSYHATLATYGAIFTSAYIILSLKFRGTFSAPFLLILGIMVMGVIGATHRLATGYSFPRDIVGGIIIGFFVAYYIIVYRLKEFKARKQLRKVWEFENISGTEKFSHIEVIKKVSVSSDDSNSNSDSEGPSDFERWASKIDSHKYIPRLQSEPSVSNMKSEAYISKQVQAVNPTMKPEERFEAKHFPPPPPPPPIPKRSQSSAGRKAEGSSNKGKYEVPRQRQSVPTLNDNKRGGYNNYGFSGSNNEPKLTLSAYKPSRATENLSRF